MVIHGRLLELTPAPSEELQAVWRAAAPGSSPREALPAQFLIVITCCDEQQQIELLRRFSAEGLECKALVS